MRLNPPVQFALRGKRGARLGVAGTVVFALPLCFASPGVAAPQADRHHAPAATGNGRLMILSPRPEALVTNGVVRARVRVPSHLDGFRVELVGGRGKRLKTRRITKLFHPVRPGLRAATLRLGRRLLLGEDHIYVTVRPRGGGRRVVQTDFIVARPRRGMVGLAALGNGLHAPVHARVRLAAGAKLRARLNGHRVGRELSRIGGRQLEAQLAADDGARFGRNRLTLTAFDRSGHYQHLVRSFTIRRDRPLVGAGPDHRALAGAAVRLDGRSTRAGSHGARLRLRWRIVDRPRGSKASLRGGGGARPRLVTDRPGRYQVRLTAGELGPPRERRRAHAAAAPVLSPTSADTVTLAAQPDVLPQGVQVKTIVSDEKPGIEVGSTFYPAQEPGSKGWVEMLVLDRATLEPVMVEGNAVNTYAAEAAGLASLAAAVAKLSSDDLAILSGVGRPATLSPQAQSSLVAALTGANGIGALLPDGAASLRFGNWSAIGVPGTLPGTAHQCVNTYCWIHPGAVPGGMYGFLQLDLKKNFAFNWPATSYTFDTAAAGSSSTANVMQVAFGENAPEIYGSAPVNGPGFHLLVLDPGTLVERGNYTYAAMVGSAGSCGGSGCLQDLQGELQQIAANPNPGLVLLTSFGRPTVNSAQGPNATWNAIARTLSGMGANPWVLLGLDGRGDYTLVGLTGLGALEGPGAGDELSQVENSAEEARLAGVFERNRQGLWQAGTNGSPDSVNSPSAFQGGLLRILEQPEKPFPFPSNRAQWAAERYIATGIELSSVDPKFGIRANYWRDQTINWASEETQLQQLGPCQRNCPQGFNVAVFRQAKRELLVEFPQVGKVMKLLGYPGGDLEAAIGVPFYTGSYDFVGIAGRIRELYNPPPAPPQGPNFGEIFTGALTVASGAAGFIPVAGGFVSASFNIVRGAYMIANALSNDGEGNSVLNPATFEGDVAKFGANMKAAAESSVEGLGQVAALLVSDRGRLEAAAREAGGSWALGPEAADVLQKSLTRSLGQYMWSAMLPVPATVAGCGLTPPSGVPGEGVAQINATNSPPGSGVFEKGYVYAMDPFGNPLPEGIYKTLFSTTIAPREGLVNLDPRYFYALANLQPNSETPISPGFVQGHIFNAEGGCQYGLAMDPPG